MRTDIVLWPINSTNVVRQAILRIPNANYPLSGSRLAPTATQRYTLLRNFRPPWWPTRPARSAVLNTSLIIDARSAGSALSSILATTARLSSAQGRSEILVVDDGVLDQHNHDLISSGVRVIRCRHTTLGQRLNMGASHSHGRMLGFCQNTLDSSWVERMMAMAEERAGLVDRMNSINGIPLIEMHPLQRRLANWLRWQSHHSARALGVERTWFDRMGGFDPSLEGDAMADLTTRLKACRANIVTQGI